MTGVQMTEGRESIESYFIEEGYTEELDEYIEDQDLDMSEESDLGDLNTEEVANELSE